MYSMVIIVNNTALYTWNWLRNYFKHSHHKRTKRYCTYSFKSSTNKSFTCLFVFSLIAVHIYFTKLFVPPFYEERGYLLIYCKLRPCSLSLELGHVTCFDFLLWVGHGKTDLFQIGKGVHQACILSPCLFSLYAEYIMRNAGLEEAQDEIKIAGRNTNNLRYAIDTTLMAESEEELKSFLMTVKEESEKVGLKLNTQKTKIMASSPITSWQIDGEAEEKVADLIFLGSKITTDGDWSNEIKRCLLLQRKVMTNIDSILKSRDITLSTKDHLVKAMVFPVVMYACDSWTIKKAEHWRIDAFELLCWRKILRVPWPARRSSQSILN